MDLLRLYNRGDSVGTVTVYDGVSDRVGQAVTYQLIEFHDTVNVRLVA